MKRIAYCHVMPVNHDFEVSVDSRVNKSDAVLLAGSEGDIVIITVTVVFIQAVDKASGCTCSAGALGLFSVEFNKSALMIPVIDKDGTDVRIPIKTRRAVNEKRSVQAISVLQREMRMIPSYVREEVVDSRLDHECP